MTWQQGIETNPEIIGLALSPEKFFITKAKFGEMESVSNPEKIKSQPAISTQQESTSFWFWCSKTECKTMIYYEAFIPCGTEPEPGKEMSVRMTATLTARIPQSFKTFITGRLVKSLRKGDDNNWGQLLRICVANIKIYAKTSGQGLFWQNWANFANLRNHKRQLFCQGDQTFMTGTKVIYLQQQPGMWISSPFSHIFFIN